MGQHEKPVLEKTHSKLRTQVFDKSMRSSAAPQSSRTSTHYHKIQSFSCFYDKPLVSMNYYYKMCKILSVVKICPSAVNMCTVEC